MCLREIVHYKCGHTSKGEVRRCPKFLKQRSKPRSSLLRLVSPKPRHCGNLQVVNHESDRVCSAPCVTGHIKKTAGVQQHQEKQKRRERERRKRQQSAARTQKEKERQLREALQRQKMERERQLMGEPRLRERIGESKQSALRPNTQPFPSQGQRQMGVYSSAPGPTAARPPPATRAEAQRAPPRLADRRSHHAYRQQNHPYTVPAGAQALPGPQKLGMPNTPRMPLTSPSTAGHSRPVVHSNGQRLRQDESGTLTDPRVRIQAGQRQPQVRPQPPQPQTQRPPAQPVAARKPVEVNRRPAHTAQPVRPRISTAASQPPPPVPPKDPWLLPQQQMTPAPLALRPRPPAPPPSQPPSGRRSAPQPSAEHSRHNHYHHHHHHQDAIGTSRPNPMFANRRAQQQQQQQQQKQKLPHKHLEWLKKTIMGGPSTETLQSVEWVSQDAARIERGQGSM